MKIVKIAKDSPLHGKVSPGADLKSVNGHRVIDSLDFQFQNTEPVLTLEIADGGKVRRLEMENAPCGDLGLTFEEEKIRICNNNCIFCFVHQQPKGMRRSLYVKDDDYRYSFTHGNFISLSGMSEADFERVITQRLSPLYISVHTTDDELRRRIFHNEKLEPILPRLKLLVENGITLHTQTVVCPGINDGDALKKTIDDLAVLAPGVDSLAVVPVGLTKYRERLPQLRGFTPEEARDVVDMVEAYHTRFLDLLGTRFVFPADEFFLTSGRPIPTLSYYEEMPQFENGVGMTRKFIVDFNRRKRHLPKRLKRRLRLEIVTGRLAEPTLQKELLPFLNRMTNLQARLVPVDNRFWGETVTVTGLLTGEDTFRTLKNSTADIILLPPNCLNADDRFLDDVPLNRFRADMGRTVLHGSYAVVETLLHAIDLWEN